MANQLIYKDKKFNIGDTISLHYKIKEGNKERVQIFKGILIKIRGNNNLEKTFTIRKISKSGIGVERIIPLSSPNIDDIILIKKSSYKKAKAYFIRNLSDKNLRKKLYKEKTKKNK